MEKPKGFLVAVGGAENKGSEGTESNNGDNPPNSFEMGVLKSLIDLIKKDEPVIEVVTSASRQPDEMATMYFEAFDKLCCHKSGHLKISSREEADQPELLRRLTECDCVLFTGGDQLRLASTLGGTHFLSILKERYQNEPFIIAGTSAGAMAMSSAMIHGGLARNAHIKGEVKISSGFAFLDNVIIDTHFDKRGRFNRLVQAIAFQPGILGIGLGEDTGIIISGGEEIKAIGSSIVTIVDGKEIRYNNIGDVAPGMPLSVENVIVHIMSNGDIYNLRSREFCGNRVVQK